MRDYQIAGCEWMVSLFENGLNGILADEMGLGKTVQCISFIAHLVDKRVKGPFLVVAPLSTLENWLAEFRRWAPSVPALLYHGTPEHRTSLRAEMAQTKPVDGDLCAFPVCITSYEIVIKDRRFLQKLLWKYIFVDEGHRLKNLNCRLIRELKSYTSANRMLLTGTPLQNNLAELWSLLNFLLPDIFDDLDAFQRWFDLSDVGDSAGNARFLAKEQHEQVLTKLHAILRPFLLRRVKSDVMQSLPRKKELVLYAPMTPTQQQLYRQIVDGSIRELVAPSGGGASGSSVPSARKPAPARKSLVDVRLSEQVVIDELGDSDSDDGGAASDDDVPWTGAPSSGASGTRRQSRRLQEVREVAAAPEVADSSPSGYAARSGERVEYSVRLLNALSQLRKCCNHPYLLAAPLDSHGQLVVDARLVQSSGKLRLLDRVLPALRAEGHRVLLFSQMTSTLDLLGEYMTMRGWTHLRIDGTVSLADRQEMIREFSDGSEVFVFLLSTRAGGLGINLPAADTVILFDSDWNPQVCDGV
jgi:ATP-dependent DNA helicase